MSYLVGIDIGTYESKGVLTTLSGQVVAAAVAMHQPSFPRPGWIEHDAETIWWGDFVTLSRRLLHESRIALGEIKGVGVSAIAPCVLPIDQRGRVLRPGILYGIDTRTSLEVAQLESELGRDVIFANSRLHLSSQAADWVKYQQIVRPDSVAHEKYLRFYDIYQ